MKTQLLYGCFDGLRGYEIAMTLEQAQSASHQGQCDADVLALSKVPQISSQLAAFTNSQLADALRESGAYDEEELLSRHDNEQRALWFAACDIVERGDKEGEE